MGFSKEVVSISDTHVSLLSSLTDFSSMYIIDFICGLRRNLVSLSLEKL